MNRRLTAMAGMTLWIFLMQGCGEKQKAQPVNAAEVEKPSPAPAGEVHLAQDSPQLKRIKVAAVQSARMALDEVVAPGKIESNPNRISRVAMPVAGRVTNVLAAVGDAVSEGQILLRIQSPDANTAISTHQQTKAKLGESKATLAKAEADLSRVKDLYAGRAIAQKEVVSAEAALAQAKSAVEQAQAAQDESLHRLEILGVKAGEANPLIAVKSPLSGKVLELAVAAGEYRNDTSAPLMTIADLSTVFMAADVPESQIRLVTRGETVKITLSAYPNEVFTGTVARIADLVDPQTRTIKVRAVLANPKGRLRPEMFGEIRHEETFRTVAVVPAGAIVQTDKLSVIYREKSAGVFEAVPVTFGKQDGERIPVLTGIAPGDRVVVDGGMLLKGVQ